MKNDDYIKRSDAINALNVTAMLRNLDSVEDGPAHMYKRAAERIIAGVPAADVEPKRKWISVTERLPNLRRFDPDGPIASSKVLFKTSDKTIHLGYVTEFSYVDKHVGMIVLHRWYNDHGDRIENVTKWFQPPKDEEDMEEVARVNPCEEKSNE